MKGYCSKTYLAGVLVIWTVQDLWRRMSQVTRMTSCGGHLPPFWSCKNLQWTPTLLCTPLGHWVHLPSPDLVNHCFLTLHLPSRCTQVTNENPHHNRIFSSYPLSTQPNNVCTMWHEDSRRWWVWCGHWKRGLFHSLVVVTVLRATDRKKMCKHIKERYGGHTYLLSIFEVLRIIWTRLGSGRKTSHYRIKR